MISYTVKVDINDSKLKSLLASMPDMQKKANKAAGYVLLNDITERFEGEGSPPSKWEALSPLTIKRREKSV